MKPILFSAAACLALLVSCSDRSEDKSFGMEKAYAPAPDEESIPEDKNTGTSLWTDATGQAGDNTDQQSLVSSSAARIDEADTVRKFIRTADLRFRVKNVRKSTLQVEDLISSHGGFVTFTHLRSDVGYVNRIPVSKDSILEVTSFTVSNQMTLRVPNHRLDTVIRQLGRFVVFLDHRIIRAEDVHLSLMKNRLKQQRIERHAGRVEDAIDEQGKKLKETTRAEDRLLDRQLQADEAAFQNLSLKDQIEFSTISLNIYERTGFFRELVGDEKNTDAWEPGFFSRLGDGFETGWNVLLNILVVLARGWSVLLLITGLFFLVRFLVKKL